MRTTWKTSRRLAQARVTGTRWGRRGYFHAYVQGRTLHEIPRGSPLPSDFFDRLRALIVREADARALVVEGLTAIAEGEHPKAIEVRLGGYLERQ